MAGILEPMKRRQLTNSGLEYMKWSPRCASGSEWAINDSALLAIEGQVWGLLIYLLLRLVFFFRQETRQLGAHQGPGK